MPLIIDGNNLIGSSPDISLSDPEARKKLVYLLKKYQETRNNNIIIVFDGQPSEGAFIPKGSNKFSVKFPKYGQTADDEIRRIVSKYNDYKEVVLITSDRELKSFAKTKGAKTVNSIEFYFELKRTYRLNGRKEELQKRIHTSVSESEVDHWLKVFSD